MPIARVNGTGLFYEEWGEGEAIIFHHGYTGSRDSWEVVAPALGQRFRAITFDCRGAGDSERPPDGHTIPGYAADVAGLADALGIGRFTYVGHSMGGAVGMQLALNHPERVSRLALVAPASADGMDRNRPATAAQAARTRELRLAGDVETIFRERIAVTARPNAERIRRSASRGLTVSDAHFEQSWESLCDLRLGARLHEIRTPTLLCAGAADPLLASNLRDFRRLPNATLHVFSSTSHFIPMEDPEGLTAMLLDFLERGPVTRAMLDARLAAVMAGAK